ncbi:uncharacterized protein LOC128547800 [Mercenaria mercenaria]|uniref:uncharacterized protein LOC128547800 n=1 Tax=Mercenaria mercenaria TaxID=6596 RepID=UPI00234F7472|nr:uncharacterized protein LOC128547800 [Mercenaria mercenaria]
MDTHKEKDGMSDVAKSSLAETDKSDRDFTTKTWREDFCFIVEDKRLYVAKVILALVSPVFERMFQSEFKEKGEAEMTLPGKKFEDIQEFLRCIYPGVMKDVTINNAHKIVALADEYQVVALKSKCEACLLNGIDNKTSAVSVCELLNLACLYSLEDLFHKCTAMAAEMPPATLDEAAGETPIPLKAKNVIHQKLISIMEKKNTETNLTVDKLKAELQRVMTLNNYHRAYTPEEERLIFDDYEGWSGTSLFLQIDTKRTLNSFTAEVCRTQIKLEFKFQSRGYFILTLTASKRPYINLRGSVVIANGMKGKRDFCKTMHIKMSERPFCFEIIGNDILLDDIEGYTHHGKIDVEVHVLGK